MQLFNRVNVKTITCDRLVSETKEDEPTLNTILSLTDDTPGTITLHKNVSLLNFYPSKYKPILTRNIPFNNVTIYKPNIEVYEQLFNNQTVVRILSYPNKPQMILGKYITETKNLNIVDIQNKTINGYYQPFLILDELFIYNNYTYSPTNFIYFDDTLLIAKFKPRYEKILYPLSDNRLVNLLYDHFEIRDNDTFTYPLPKDCIDGVVITDYDFTIHRPKLMFSTNKIDWKVYNFETGDWEFVNPDNGEYFTPDEFRSKGMTYTDYLNIPLEAFTNNSEDWYVMMNNYIIGFKLHNSYYDDYLGTTKFAFFQPNSYGHNLVMLNI